MLLEYLISFVRLFTLSLAFAQPLTGPGIKDGPPASAVEVQDRQLGKDTSSFPTKDEARLQNKLNGALKKK